MSGPRAKDAPIGEFATPVGGLLLTPVDPDDGARQWRGAEDAEREPCVIEAGHYAALLRDMATRLRAAAERGDSPEIVDLADLFDETALTLEAKERERATGPSSS